MRLINTAPILALALLVTSCAKVQNSVTVVNNSGVKADRVIVTVCGQDVIFENLETGKQQSRSFSVTGDSGFLVSASLSDGTVASNSFGYVTGGAGSYGNHAEIEIAPDKSLKGKQL
ncbi:MAG: hypothetical protein FJY66_05725 [Calditrichaeota bacterium]|nr:hypothetical protein [Calditrichota bacterium]